MAKLDIAPARYWRDESNVLDFTRGDSRLVVVVDGDGSWDFGAEAAQWVRERLAERWRDSAPVDAAAFASDLRVVATGIPDELHDDSWGDSGNGFSIAAAFVRGPSVQVVAQGRMGALHFGQAGVVPLYTPASWVMEQVSAGLLTGREALEHPLRAVSIGPYVSSATTELCVNEPLLLRSAEGIVLGDLELFSMLLRAPLPAWSNLSAAQLQALVGKHAVVKIALEGVVA